MKKTILRHCKVNAGVTEFAFLGSGGNFFRLDELGNFKVFAQDIRSSSVFVTIEGSIDRATLNVVSMRKQ